jgi:hypothetical protein
MKNIVDAMEEIDLKKTKCPNCENEIEISDSDYTKFLADAREDYEETIKDYEDALASKELDIIVLKVKLESLEQKSADVIDDVIERTQTHMLNEVADFKKGNELRVAKILAEAKEYFKQKILEKESEITKLKKNIESIAQNNFEKETEIAKLKRGAESITQNNFEKEAEIAKLKKEIEATTLNVETIQRKKNLVIAKLKEEKDLIQKDFSKLKEAEKQKSEEISRLKQEIAKREEKTFSQNVAVEIQEILRNERKKSEETQNPKSTAHLSKTQNPKATLHSRELQGSKTTVQPIEKTEQKPKFTLAGFIGTIILITGNILFIFVIYPNIANWVDSVGLNDLSITIRILIITFGIMISLFSFVKAKEFSSKRAYHIQKRKDGHSIKFLLGIIVIGLVLLIVFLFSSNFLFFIVGTILIILAGLLVVNHGRYPIKQKSGGKSWNN